jgi:hypothetical protein
VLQNTFQRCEVHKGVRVNISRNCYEIRNAELLETKWNQFPMGAIFICNTAPMTGAMLWERIEDMLCITMFALNVGI